MADVLKQYKKKSRRRQRRAAAKHQRLDIQGLRMVAVLTVFANHLWGWPTGGFVGVDVFFVISGFLITGNLLRTAETTGKVSFRAFYWNRVRRIVPAATVVLALTYLASLIVFLPFRSHQVGVDALFAFAFMANWRFAFQDTDYFNAGDAVSPLQHYWSLSIEEQFYFVWPALIFLISVIVIRKAWSHTRRMAIAGVVMGCVVAASLTYAIVQTATAPAWAYFDTLTRIWELGAGALLAIAAGLLARIPAAAKPILSWGGLVVIAASMYLLSDGSAGFPAPWALLPVLGAALVIAAGVGGEPKNAFLRNPLSGYVGDISYSLYLVHWPVIVLLASIFPPSAAYTVAAVFVSFGLACASYHLVENPLRRADWASLRSKGWWRPSAATQYGAAVAATCLVIGLAAFTFRPVEHHAPVALPAAVIATTQDGTGVPEPAPDSFGPAGKALAADIATALQATDWPALNPSMEDVIGGREAAPDVVPCGTVNPPDCSWGAGPLMVVVGDSVGLSYVGPLREVARSMGMRLHTEAMPGCTFIDDLIANDDQTLQDACPARKQRAIDYITANKPQVVVIANSYTPKHLVGSDGTISPNGWSESMAKIVARFPGTKILFLSPPPADVNIGDCYGTRGRTPADCVSYVDNQWLGMARAERDLATKVNGVWVDSRPWFCSQGACPPFAGSTPTKHDDVHMSPEYGVKIAPAMVETFATTGVA